MKFYFFGLFLVCGSWLGWRRPLRWCALLLLLLAFGLHTFSIVERMMLLGRPPVTNLPSLAVFVGWCAVIFGFWLEYRLRDGVGFACAGGAGFVALFLASRFADTMEPLPAVLDNNFFLATHIVTIALGYAAMFFAGMLGVFYVLRGARSQSIPQVTYGVLCFALFFCFIGTAVGGIWADQSWGRFWGWDPKENGALLVILWCALVLHARRGGYIGERGLMAMSIAGNIVTSFSWFGVNMLGVGLHAYDSMGNAIPWLLFFMASQLVFILILAHSS